VIAWLPGYGMPAIAGPATVPPMDRPHRGVVHPFAPKATQRFNPAVTWYVSSHQKSHFSLDCCASLLLHREHVVDLGIVSVCLEQNETVRSFA
jgi:hypothetical protein